MRDTKGLEIINLVSLSCGLNGPPPLHGDIHYLFLQHSERVTETYANTVGSYADIIYAATRLTNNMLYANTEAFNISSKRAIEFSKISFNNVKTLGQTAIEYTKSLNQLAAVRDSSTEKEIQKK